MGFTLNQLEQERQIRKLQKKEDKDTSNYEQLSNLPKINNVELKGDKTTSDLGINADNVMMSDGVTSVEDALDSLTDDSGWVTVVANYLFYRKIGKLVEVQISTDGLAISSSAWTTIGTLPAGVRPHAPRRFTPIAFNGKSFVVNISVNGLVQYESDNTFNFSTSIMYFAE